MKPALLLIAIYSLIIHQSNKNAKQMATPVKKPVTNSISFQVNSSKKPVTSPDLSLFNPTDISDHNAYIKW